MNHDMRDGRVADFDHTSFAVRDALVWSRTLRSQAGAVPIIGETLDEFRYLLMYIGDGERGSRIEFIEPTGDGFLSRYLDKHGEGAHHLTFTVPDVAETSERARELGFSVVGENYGYAPWQESFILPDSGHRIVVQLAASDRNYLPAAELLTTEKRDPMSQPHVLAGRARDWWTSVWMTPARDVAHPGPTHLASSDLGATQRLFGELLGGQSQEFDNGVLYRWASGSVEVYFDDKFEGITRLPLEPALDRALEIGPVRIGDESLPRIMTTAPDRGTR